MPGRKRRARCIAFDARFICFKPCGRPGRDMESLELGADELEALRLSDFEGLYQEECARRMGISRTTLSRTLTQAHQKVADALLHGKRLMVSLTEEVAATGNGKVVPLARSPQPAPAGRVRSGGRGRGQGPES